MNEIIRNDRDIESSRPRGIGALGWLRWAWRQLTSMKVAIILLLILVIAIIPASFLPQRFHDPLAVNQWIEDNGFWGQFLDALGFFSLLSAPWFAAIYLLLFISLVGCIVPRTGILIGNIRRGPGRIPRNFERFTHESAQYHGTEEDGLDAVAASLKGYRTVRRDGGLSASTGLIREAGNLIFHMSLLALLIIFALSQALSYRGQAILVEGDTFTNSVLSFDTFERGAFLDESSLDPYRITLDAMNPQFGDDGAPSAFSADVTVDDGSAVSDVISPNHPLDIDGTHVYLSGNGYAPHLKVTDDAGNVVFDGDVVFPDITQDYVSSGVIKIPDTTDRERQIGMQATLYPSAVIQEDGTVISVHPDAQNPVLVLTTWVGDLGLDSGIPENVYVMNTDEMELVRDESGLGVLTILPLGQSIDLPDNLGTIEFTDLSRFAAFDLRHDPTLMWMLVFALLGMGGIAASLLLPERRIWARIEDGELHIAGMGRKHDEKVAVVLQRALSSVQEREADGTRKH